MSNQQKQTNITLIGEQVNKPQPQLQEQNEKNRDSLSTGVVSSSREENWSQIQQNDPRYSQNWEYFQDPSFVYPTLQQNPYHSYQNQCQWQLPPPYQYHPQYSQVQYQNYCQQYWNYQNQQYPTQAPSTPYIKMGEYKSEVIQKNDNTYLQNNSSKGGKKRFRERFDQKFSGFKNKLTGLTNKFKGLKTKKQDQLAQRREQSAKNTEECQQQKSENEGQAQILYINQQLQRLNITNTQQQQINKLLFNLQPYFNKYHVNQWRKQRITDFLASHVKSIQNMNLVIDCICQLQIQSPQYFTSKNIHLFKIIRQIIKNSFNIPAIKERLSKKIYLYQKKQYHDQQFQQNYPNPYHIDFLQLQELQQLNRQKTVFFVDGNNIMPKQKKFRMYFESHEDKIRAEGQIRLAWLFCQAVQCQMFFDNMYSWEIYNDIKFRILSKKEQKMVNSLPVYFADKHLNPNNTADMKLTNRLSEVMKTNKYKGYDIILVSADQELAQLCYAIAPIKKTSGIYIFKYCKGVIREKYYNKPQMKDIIKRIFTYDY